MIQAAKIVGTGLATTGLIGAGIGIGVVFGGLILGVSRNLSLRRQLFSYTILGFAFSEATGLFALMMSLLDRVYINLNLILRAPPAPYSFASLPVKSCLDFISYGQAAALFNLMSVEMVNLCLNLVTQATMHVIFAGSNQVSITDVLNCIGHYYPQFPLANIYSVIITYKGYYGGPLFVEFCSEFPNLIRAINIANYMGSGPGIDAPLLSDILRDRGLNDTLTALRHFRI